MLCPGHDSQLVARAPTPLSGLALHYLYCPNCHGHWLAAFDANYIRSIDLEGIDSPQLNDKKLASQGLALRSGIYTSAQNLTCPQCRKILVRTLEESIPPDVMAYQCPDHHGYFFPDGELARFKKAQETKLAYHKQWRVPLSSVASALLMTLFGLLVSAGLIAGVLEGQRQETIRVQAEGVISSERYYVDQTNKSVTFIAITSEPMQLMLVMDNVIYPMVAPDNKSHVAVIKLSGGDHTYFFRFTKNNTVYDTQPHPFPL